MEINMEQERNLKPLERKRIAISTLEETLRKNGFTVNEQDGRNWLEKDGRVYNYVTTVNTSDTETSIGYTISNGHKRFNGESWSVFFLRYLIDEVGERHLDIRVCSAESFAKSSEKQPPKEGEKEKITWNLRNNTYDCTASLHDERYDWRWLDDWMRDPSGENGLPKRESVSMRKLKSVDEIIKNALQSGAKQVVFTGAPGTGKTYSVRKYVKRQVEENGGDYKFIQFHSSYDYSDFVEGLRPVMIDSQMVFVRMDGVFKRFCRKAATDLSHTYYFIIDEINRADLSRVFGELMFSFEESYRGRDCLVETQYANLDTYVIADSKAAILADDCFKDGFYVPENVLLIGTMNDIDRSVEAFDFALRRRFKWIDIKANEVMESSLGSILGGKAGNLAERVIAMNRVISEDGIFGLGEAFHIGPAYFKEYDGTEKSLIKIWENRVEPILREYTRGRNERNVAEFIEDCRGKLFKKPASEEIS
ncbi:MAG: AAA family ATPase [Clostridia bacterium]|nr:AAA family ATPase [Clostridia bacterium]